MTTTSVASRIVNGIELPAPGTWVIDPSHSSVEVVARHMMISKVRGRFDTFAGTIVVAETPEESSVELTVDAASISSADARRDEHLRNPDFLDTARYPQITFRSTSIEPATKGHWAVTGDLTVRDVTRSVTVDVELEGVGAAYGGPRAVLSATAEVDREDFGLTWNMALETGGVLVGRQLKLELNIQAVPEQPAA
ncbi:MAG TPA: YceI family protein [Acidimicrobiales bacterium]|nr:YceI family protein [Acidimicrobiales bacterium]